MYAVSIKKCCKSSDGSGLVVLNELGVENLLRVDHEHVINGVLVVAGPRFKHVDHSGTGNVGLTDGGHGLTNIAASNSADTSPVVIVSLVNEPVLLGDHVNVGDAITVAGNDGTLITGETCDGIVRRSNLSGGGESVEGTSVV